jgi:hypothetical protein
VDPVDPIDDSINQALLLLINSLSDSYDYLLELYDSYPDLENELRKAERKITKAHHLVNSIYDSGIDYTNFFSRKKTLRKLRKITYSIEDTIDHLACIGHPKAFYDNLWNDGYLNKWDSHKGYFLKKKFFKRPDYSESYDFEDILNSLKEVQHNIRNVKKEIRKVAYEARITDFEQSDYFLKSSLESDEFLDTIIDYWEGIEFDGPK